MFIINKLLVLSQLLNRFLSLQHIWCAVGFIYSAKVAGNSAIPAQHFHFFPLLCTDSM